jgi:hypothetical protein
VITESRPNESSRPINIGQHDQSFAQKRSARGNGAGPPKSGNAPSRGAPPKLLTDPDDIIKHGFEQAAATLAELRSRGVVCAVWAIAGSARNIKEAAFCWQHKKVLTLITETFSESDQAASALAVYVAMTKLASDKGSATFTAAKSLIAHTAGVSVSTVQRLLKGFEQLGVVKIKRRAIAGAFKAPNTYTLLAIGHHDASIGHEPCNLKTDRTDIDKKRKEKKNDISACARARSNSTPGASRKPRAQTSSSLSSLYQNQPAQNHVKFKEFAAWCRRKGGKPTESGFWTWLCGQKPQWRNRVKKDFDEEGYTLDGEFLTIDEANRRGAANPELITRFRKAVKCDGKIVIQP